MQLLLRFDCGDYRHPAELTHLNFLIGGTGLGYNIAHVLWLENLVVLDLSDNTIKTNIGLKMIADLVRFSCNLTFISLRNNQICSGIGFNHIMTALTYTKSVRTLDLSNNLFREEQVLPLSKMLALNESVQVCFLDIDAGMAFGDFFPGISPNTSLLAMSFRCRRSSLNSESFSLPIMLQELDLSNSCIDGIHSSLLQYLRLENSNLLHLNLSNCGLRCNFAIELAECLENSQLSCLILQHNFINDIGAAAILKILIHNNKIKKICLKHNVISRSISNIADVFRRNTTIEEFSLTFHHKIDSLSEIYLSIMNSILRNTTLKKISIISLNIDNSWWKIDFDVAIAFLFNSVLESINITYIGAHSRQDCDNSSISYRVFNHLYGNQPNLDDLGGAISINNCKMFE
jgi:Ran GTPase-activating protein (RanGAP) involved in mRNA processing and transport